MDLECENKNGVTLKDLEWIHLHKTAALLKVRLRNNLSSFLHIISYHNIYLFCIPCLLVLNSPYINYIYIN